MRFARSPRLYAVVVFFCLIVSVMPARADRHTVDQAADNWAEQLAGESTDDFLRDLEKDVPIDPSARNALKGALKSFIKRKIKERLIPGNISLAMESILNAIRDKLKTQRGDPCQLAAINTAWNSLGIYRVLRGAANTFPEVLGGAAGGAGILRNIGAAIAGQVRKRIEEAIDRYLADYRVETFAETRSAFGCNVTIRVVWIKQKGEYHYVLMGDCGCKDIPVRGGGRTMKLSRWSITGKGSAAWVGEEREKANEDNVVPQSAIRGRAAPPRMSVSAICCRQNTPETPGYDPWSFDPPPQTERPRTGTTPQPPRVTTGTDPEPVPRTRTNEEVLEENRGNQDPTGAIPEIPAGPVCPEEKQKLQTAAFNAWRAAVDRKELAQAAVERLEGDRLDGKTVSDADMQTAQDAVTAADAHLKAAERAREAADALETTDCPKPDDHSGLIPSEPVEEGYAIAVEVPERCVGTWYYLDSGVSEPDSSINISYAPEELVDTPETVTTDEPEIPVCTSTPTETGQPETPTPPTDEDQPSPPTTTTEVPPEQPEEPEEPDLGLVKADITVVELALSSVQTGEPVEGATLKLLQPAPELPSNDETAETDAALTSAENYQEDVPAATADETGTVALQLTQAEDGANEPELALVEEPEDGTAAGQETAAAPADKREIKIDTAPSRQLVVAGNKPMTGLPASLAPAASKICIRRGFRVGPTPVFVVDVPQAEVPAFTGSLGSSEVISWFEPDPCRKKEFSDPFFKSKGLWGQKFDNQWAIKRVGYDVGKPPLQSRPTDKPVTVAVIDTGIDWYHPDLPHSAIWINPNETRGNGRDDDGNGYVDDIMGWNFIRASRKPWDYDGHGTFVAGVIAAGRDNGTGIVGLNPSARIMVLKALDAFGRGHASHVAEAIAYAADNGARVINLSLGGRGLTKVEQLAVDHARAKGAIIVAASGNAGKSVSQFSPAGLNGVITVSATDRRDKRAGFSNWGTAVDIAAPGVDVLSLRARRTDLLAFISGVKYNKGEGIVGDDRAYYRASGTSFSAPIVAGTLSLLLSRNPALKPDQAIRMILQSATDIETPGVDNYSGYGLIDAEAALKADPEYFIESRIDGAKVVGGSKPAVRIIGTAAASEFAEAAILIGKGDRPEKWFRVNKAIVKPVLDGALMDLPAKFFAGAKSWTIRLITTHKNGTRREARFALRLG